MAIPIMIPSSGELGSEITLVRWLVRSGDTVEPGTPLAEIEADKGVIEVEAPGPGTVLGTFCVEGQAVSPGTILGYLGRPGEALPKDGLPPTPPRAAPEQAATAPEPPRKPPSPPRGAGRPHPQAAPATRRRAKALGVDLTTVAPTGAGGTVTMRDVEAAAARGEVRRDGAGPPPAGARGGGAGRPLSANQRVVAAQVTRSHREIPSAHFTTRVDARHATRLRGGGVGYTALFVFAAARALARFPAFRSRLQGDHLVALEAADVAFAVAGEADELYTPVVRAADTLGLKEIDARVLTLAAAARQRRLEPAAFAGGSFLVTNLGMFAVESFDPVIYPGHSGALAVGAVQMLPAAVPQPPGAAGEESGWGVEIRPTLSLTLAVDHRLINGVEAARALAYIKDLVEGGAE